MSLEALLELEHFFQFTRKNVVLKLILQKRLAQVR